MRELAVLVVLLSLVSYAHAQEYYDTPHSLSVEIIADSQFVYRENGYTIVVGEVKNGDSHAFVGDVRLQAKFFGGTGDVPLDIVAGNTTLQVIPPNSKSPFMIRSATPDEQITDVSVSLAGFDGSGGKAEGLMIHSTDVIHEEELSVKGVIRNSGPERGVMVHVVIYDGFDPPRVLGVESFDIGDMLPNSKESFEFLRAVDYRAVSLVMLAESDSSYTKNRVEVVIPQSQEPRNVAQITDVPLVYTTDKPGEIPVGSTVRIDGVIDSASDVMNTQYVYYVQIKESGQLPYVAFLGFTKGVLGDGIIPSVYWTPENKGLYFIETFVWDSNGVPLAERGPFKLVLVS
ncbi:MAG: hypothetical protein D9C04_00550 [Nitrosopumilus sp. B06]|nr:MAG: hypothetical protein D9C04_00550 [Nitrosopumilus sp. B06]